MIVKRPRPTQGFRVLQWRWSVERTFGWLNRSRRLKERLRGLPETTEAWSDRHDSIDGEAFSSQRITFSDRLSKKIVEQDHRAVKRVTRPMLGFKAFDAAQDTLVGIELMHMIKKKQLIVEEGDESLTAAELFYSLAA